MPGKVKMKREKGKRKEKKGKGIKKYKNKKPIFNIFLNV
jgi:hypothetical protein